MRSLRPTIPDVPSTITAPVPVTIKAKKPKHGIVTPPLLLEQKSELSSIDLSARCGGRVLVLGMAYVTESEAQKAGQETKRGTSSSVYRDWRRLDQLEKMFHFKPVGISCGSNGEPSDRYIKSHVGANVLHKTKAYDYIFADYFRMPNSSYFKLIGKPFVEAMLPSLIRQGLVTSDTKIVLPNYRDDYNGRYLKEFFIGRAQTSVTASYTATVSYIRAEDYPLWQATETLDDGVLDGHSNRDEVYGTSTKKRMFNPRHPFMVAQYDTKTIQRIAKTSSNKGFYKGSF